MQVGIQPAGRERYAKIIMRCSFLKTKAMAKQAAADRSDHPTTIHPVLKAALGCMDVQLEEELARYRRQRHEASRRGVPAPVAPLTTAAAIAPPSPTPAIANDANDIADLTRQPPARMMPV